MLRVRTRPECPDDNLRELTRDSNQNRGAISRERQKERSFKTPGNTLSSRSVASLGISEGKITRGKNK